MKTFCIVIEKSSIKTDIKSVDVDFLDSIEAAKQAASQIFGLPFTRKDFGVEGVHNSFHRRYRIAHKRVAAFWVDVEIVFRDDDDPCPPVKWEGWKRQEVQKQLDAIGRAAFEKEYLGEIRTRKTLDEYEYELRYSPYRKFYDPGEKKKAS